MPDLLPFRGLRYDPARVRLHDVIAPPYDVISPTERRRLAARHSANSVQLELPEPDLRTGLDRYAVAASLLADWRQRGLLVPDAKVALYPYRMTQPDGRTTTGVIGALGLPEPGSDGDVLPHEETLPKPRSDRLELLRATRANFSPIWGLSLTAGLSASFEPEGPPDAEALDDDRVLHQLWVLDDAERVESTRRAVAASPVVIADGHHRYQTALAYRDERRRAGQASTADEQVMALVVELAEDQLHVGPIHRSLSGLPGGAEGALAAFGQWFDLVRAGPSDERTLAALGRSGSLALVTTGGAYLLTPTPKALEAAGDSLDSGLVALALDELPGVACGHPHTWEEAASAFAAGEAEAVVLLRPPTVTQIAEWAAARRTMPPKSTYFSPKPRTGMVFRLLDP
ncbi:MAG TPA: DUF1015 domain-containing protein [Acidimicrobiales bacterium]|nr:DUF1015 domain-containing protein [Acidimicrobiales bacterium]